jgi:hypothetical protein
MTYLFLTASVTTASTAMEATAMTTMTTMTTAAVITTTAIITTATSYFDGENEVDARRLIRVRGIDDHWRSIDVKPERRCDGYTTDH